MTLSEEYLIFSRSYRTIFNFELKQQPFDLD